MINKKISTIAGSLIIVAIVIALGFIFFIGKEKATQNQNNVVLNNSDLEGKKEVKQEEKEIIVSKSLASKELYRNEKYGFEFVSPQDLFFKPNSTDDNIILSDKADGHWLFQISVYKNSDNLLLKDITEQEIKKISNNYSFDVSDIKIDKELAKKVLIKNYSDYGNITIVLVHKDNIIKIYGDNSTKLIDENFESIINSFKFSK